MKKTLSVKTQILLTVVFIALFGILLSSAEQNLNSYFIRIISLIGIFSIMAVSLTLVNGVSGMLSLGHAGFIAIGAYTSSLLTMTVQQKEASFILTGVAFPLNTEILSNMPFFWATLIGGIAAAIMAFAVGWPSMRLAGDYLAITTLGFAEIIRIILLNWSKITNGSLGLKGIPSYTNVWWSWGWLMITLIVIGSFVKSSYGRALRAIRDDPIAAKSMGINVFKHQLTSFVISGFFAGVSGSLYAHWLTSIDPKPTTLGISLTFNILIMIVLGGLGSLSGAVIGAGLFAVLSELLRVVESDITIFGLTIPGISGMRMLVFSALFIIMMIFWQKGIMGRNELTWNSLYKGFRKIGKRGVGVE
ncbi:MAG TPA: branched-chain amino acid ABC transporter permease [Thermotogota bacterium]|nr:branched-chain amino acid ABC transporter permease [Thermotogota bacterium]HPJ87521.1 branched-chain amino acid ABC transporter permease [Thermotogota bacterium]HPR94726.1 branched-chain amino acid ABC transporter permease [Thermotogota bacterium]